jgi:hypothetical protein
MLRDADGNVTPEFSLGSEYSRRLARMELSNAGWGCLSIAIIFGVLGLILAVVGFFVGDPDESCVFWDFVVGAAGHSVDRIRLA